VNGDGFSDYLVGVKLYLTTGCALLYLGGTETINSSPDLTAAYGLVNSRLGAAVANAGDVNGDGFSDVLAGAPDASNGEASEGLAYLHYGSATGISTSPSLTLELNVAGARFGYSVASAGDVDGDGYADAIIGAPNAPGGGRAYVFMGGPGGLSTSPAYTLTGAAGAEFGSSVCTAGDINADGYAEVIVGAPGIASAFVYGGSPSGLVTAPQRTLTGAAGSRFGAVVSTAGDVDGTGYSDVIVGAPLFTNGQADEGGAFIYLGRDTGLAVPAATQIERNLAGARFGSSVAGAGDVNGDGYFEVAIGAPNWASGEANEGGGFIYYGSAAGITTGSPTIVQPNIVGAQLGFSCAEGGDVNGDGYADVVFGAPYLTNGETEEGRVYVALGAPVAASGNSSLESNSLGIRFGWAVAGGGDVNGDGYSDILAGGPNAAPSLLDQGSLYVMGGNKSRSLSQLTRQYRADLVSPLSTNSYDYADYLNFGIGHRSKSPIGRTSGRLLWEVVGEGQAFSGSPITNSMGYSGAAASFSDLGVLGVELKQLVSKIPIHKRYKWRVRVEYAQNKLVDGQRFSRWYYGYASGIGDIGILPIELIAWTGSAVPEGNRLEWSTASERGTARFMVERSTDGRAFASVGAVAAAGTSSTLRRYAMLDAWRVAGTAYYRLRSIDTDGRSTLSEVVAVNRGLPKVAIYPNPAVERISWPPSDGVVRVELYDSAGQLVRWAPARADGSGEADALGLEPGAYQVICLDAQGRPVATSRFVKAQAPMVR
jgi:hypothetical protein